MQNDLLGLREDLLRAVQPLVDADNLSDEDRLRLTMRLAAAQQNAGLYRKAFDLIGKIEGDDNRLEQYLDLLDEVEFTLNEQLEEVQPVEEPKDSQA